MMRRGAITVLRRATKKGLERPVPEGQAARPFAAAQAANRPGKSDQAASGLPNFSAASVMRAVSGA